MPTILKTKNSVTTTVVPTTLQQGELAVNITDKKLWVGNAATTPVQLLGDGGSGSFSSIAFGAGTVSAPSITFTGDTNTGIYSPAADTIAFTEGGTEAMRLTSAGDVGIGTTSPAQRLDVVTSGGNAYIRVARNAQNAGQVGLHINGGTSGTDWYIANFASTNDLSFFGNGSERMRIDSSGNVGIGVTSITSGYKAQINGSLLLGTTANPLLVGTTTLNLYGDNSSSSGMTINTAGNVGIGTASPSERLTVSGAISSTSNAADFNQSKATFDYASGAGRIASHISTGSNLQFYTNPNGGTVTERMRITSDGTLIVNGTATSGFFDGRISSFSATLPGLSAKTSGGAAMPAITSWNTATSGDNLFLQFATEASPAARGSITYNRTAGLTAYNTTSDYRAKDIISPVLNSGEVIDSVPVYMGKMKDATQARPMFIAHETPDYAHTGEKDAVDKDGNPVYQHMDASSLVPVLWAEVQSLRKRLALLECK